VGPDRQPDLFRPTRPTADDSSDLSTEPTVRVRLERTDLD
jgi:hypothetical protein